MKKASTVVKKVDFEESSMRRSMKPGSRDVAARLESDGGVFTSVAAGSAGELCCRLSRQAKNSC